jgi:hypothetical protein
MSHRYTPDCQGSREHTRGVGGGWLHLQRPAAHATMLISVVIPEGLFAGDSMSFAFGVDEFAIVVPPGMHGGEAMEVEIPDIPEHAASSSSPSTVIVTVPAGCYMGDEFTVEFDSRTFSIGVPDGCGPGDEIEVAVPLEEALSPSQLVGRRVTLCGLVAKGILNGRKGSVLSYSLDKDQLLVAIDGMCPEVAVT